MAEAVLSEAPFALCGMDWFNWEEPWRSLYCFSEQLTKREIFVLFAREGSINNDNTTFCLLCGDRASREHKG